MKVENGIFLKWDEKVCDREGRENRFVVKGDL